METVSVFFKVNWNFYLICFYFQLLFTKTFFYNSNHFEEHFPPFNRWWNLKNVGTICQPVHGEHPPHQRQTNRTEQRLCLCSTLIPIGMLFLQSGCSHNVGQCIFLGCVQMYYNHMFFLSVQEASQLLTILQSLQPPLKLDGKTVGVDYAKSARKWVFTRILFEFIFSVLAKN